MANLKFIEPMYARAVEKLPEGRDWVYEIKLDGYRCLAGRDAKGVILWSRTANIFTTQFPTITRSCEKLQPDTLIDGEIVAIDDSGRPSFNLLQHHRSKASAIQFYAFDIPIDRGRSLLAVPLETRRELLNEARHAVSDPIRLSEAFGKENNAYPGYPKRPKRKRRCGKQLHQEIHVRATMAESDK
jgi:ATP-dependent DNA ligase